MVSPGQNVSSVPYFRRQIPPTVAQFTNNSLQRATSIPPVAPASVSETPGMISIHRLVPIVPQTVSSFYRYRGGYQILFYLNRIISDRIPPTLLF